MSHLLYGEFDDDIQWGIFDQENIYYAPRAISATTPNLAPNFTGRELLY